MKKLRQWINWKSIKKPNQAKPAKVPYCYKTNQKINAHDPANWMTFEEARTSCEYIGFVLTANDPYFCIDLDHSFKNGQWSQFSLDILTWFQGAYVEVSYSQDGLHIFGRCEDILPDHMKKVKFGESLLELYSNDRFIAYTGIQASGDCNTNCTVNLRKFINDYMVSIGGSVSGSMPNTTISTVSKKYGGYLKPDPEWIGPKDDDELIRRMLTSKKSINALLNGRASVKDLWNNNVSVLTETYPDFTGEYHYDRSSADMALATQLAFWTGRDGPRIDRMIRKSGLKRDKWDNHKEYLSGAKYTIHKACSACKNVYRDPKLLSEKVTKESKDDNYLMVSQFLSIDAQVKYFNGCCYILDRHCIFTPKHGVLKPEQFNTLYAGKTFALTSDCKTTTKKAFDALTMSQGYIFPKVAGSCFRPEHKSGEIININNLQYVNTYIPVNIAYSYDSAEPFVDFVGRLLQVKSDYDYFMNWSASANQNIGVKFRWCIVLQGIQGNGKSLLMRCVAHGIGEKFTFSPQANDIGNKFNSWINEKLFITVDEIDIFNKFEMSNALKPLITNDRIAIQAKGVDAIMIDNRANFGMTTNHKNAILKTELDRRYAIFFTAQQEKEDLIRDGLDGKYFKEYFHWLTNENGYNIIAGYLKRFPIVDALNPATLLLTAPETSSTREAIQISKSIVHQEIQEAIEEGVYGFRGGWISSYAVTKLLESKQLVKFSPVSKRKTMLKELGYIVMPWVSNGRASGKLINEENTRPVLYIKESLKYGNPLTTNDYINAQSEN